ncbi:hypothetical protein [Roseateles terrae]|uniref:Uncharacterized protein n=1 Tax=Roseateles terrae TaxID=431060 RepID=A0ABR6GY69_9BURK|nr:hypothetical protein [Roseateles terrae]MBB3197055.1 hypothetical protein [Roseateles terrae]OWQ84220.1 hypothetical protein CDN98_19750 [Roseateles terrae]
MFKASGSPFLSEVAHFYTDQSFQLPPQLAPPVPPKAWVSYHPMDADGPASFREFRASPAFGQALQQFLDRIADCEAFTRTHFSPREASVMLEYFHTFRTRLTDGNGEPHFGDALPQLYSRGKLHFDRFCLRLAQDDLDLPQRKTVLRELAFHLRACRAQGPAFEEAARRLDRKPGGLQGEFHELLMMHTDALLREVINRPAPGLVLSPAQAQDRLQHLHSMEVHMVNRLRLELGLPGGDRNDRFVLADSLVTPSQIEASRRLLHQQLRPAALARELAGRYMEQLREMLPVALRAPDADLSEHTGEIDRAQQRMEATFGKVALDHLLEYDIKTERTGWLQDLSLVAYDLLGSLERQGLIVPQPRGSLMRGSTGNAYWELMQVDWRLFLTEEYERLDGPRRQTAVQLSHALGWLDQMPAMNPVPALVDAVLASSRKEDLLYLPRTWLMDESRCAAFCRRLGEDTLVQWLERNPDLSDRLRGQMLRVITDLGLQAALLTVTTPAPHCDAAACVRLAGGGDVLVKAMNRQDGDMAIRWFAVFQAAIPLLKEAEALRLFCTGTPGLVGQTLRNGHGGHVRQVLRLLALAVDQRKIHPGQLPALLKSPVQDIMAAGHVDRLVSLGEGLQVLAKGGHLQNRLLCQALAGPDWQRGCSGAMVGGHPHVVRWFHEQVRVLLDGGSINRDQAARLLMSHPRGEPSAGMLAIEGKHAEALAVHLSGLLEAVSAGIVPAPELRDLLACRGAAGEPGLAVMTKGEKPHPCTQAWRTAVVEANERHLLMPWEVGGLVSAHDPQGLPLLRQLVRTWFSENRSWLWLGLVKDLFHAKALPAPFPVLEAVGGRSLEPPETLLFRLMTDTSDLSAVWLLMKLYGEARREQMIEASDLALLLLGLSKGEREVPALTSALGELQSGQVTIYLRGLILLAQQGLISADQLFHLFDGYGRGDRSPLGAAIDKKWAEGVEHLLDATLKAARQQLITGDQWSQLLRSAPASRSWTVILNCRCERIQALIHSAIKEADTAGLLQGEAGAELMHAWRQRTPLPA